MDYIKFWTGFQKKLDKDNRIKELFDDTRNESGRGKDKNSFVFDFKVDNGNEKIPYCITAQANTRTPFISVDMYFKKRKKYAIEILDFFVREREELQKRIGKGLYISDTNKSEVRISLRNILTTFDEQKEEEYYDWYIDNLIKMRETFEGLRFERGFFPEKSA